MEPNEDIQIRTFVRHQLSDAPDLGTLTLGCLRRKYMSHVGCESMTQEAKMFMKRVIEEELMKTQNDGTDVSESDNASIMSSGNKRKRGEEDEEAITEKDADEYESSAKKRYHQSSSSERAREDEEAEKPEEGSSETGRGESEEEDEMDTSLDQDRHPVGRSKRSRRAGGRKNKGEDDDAEEQRAEGSDISEEGKKPGGNSLDGNGKWKVKRGIDTVSKARRAQLSSDEEKESSASQSDTGGKGEEADKKESDPRSDSSGSVEAGSDRDEEVTVKKNKDEVAEDSSSSSSSLPSLEDDNDSGRERVPAKKETKNKGDKKKRKEGSTKNEKGDDKAVVRLKRYISLCGVKRNYKKLLEGCRSIRSKVAILKKELEDLGVQGKPSIALCKKARLKREEAQELAELDVSNIITTQGRPKRRGASAWQDSRVSPSTTYKRTVNSDSDEGSPTGRGLKRATDWGNLQSIISDDGDSD